MLQQTLLPKQGQVTFVFVLRNAATAQAARPMPKVGIFGVLPQELTGAVLGATGVAAVTSAVVEESGRVVGQTNVLTFRLTSNVPLPPPAQMAPSSSQARSM